MRRLNQCMCTKKISREYGKKNRVRSGKIFFIIEYTIYNKSWKCFSGKKLQWWYNKNIPDTFLYKYMKDLGIQCCNRNRNIITNDKNSNTTIATPPTHFITSMSLEVTDYCTDNFSLLWRMGMQQPFVDIHQNRCFEEFRKFHRKIPGVGISL